MKALIVVALKAEFNDEIPKDFKMIYTGVGKVNAAFNLTKTLELLDKLPPLIINYGTAGSKNLEIGQIVDCTKFIQRDMYIKQFGLKPGETAFDIETYKKHYNAETPPIILDFKEKINNNPLGKNLLCATGDNFVTEFNSDLSDIEKTYNEDLSVIDMEAYALAKIAFLYNISFISFKYITDNLDSKGSSDWEKHVSKGASMFKELLKNYT
ncbi:MAG: 5'-methylthioadenosine/S-adenosylhomocysteine nucleosidase [SAR202 cluster bacterium]|uniref:Nucleoside phosphorylase domain-containing protein n=1 Tax=marine metagenome TaxID=408172 RepID=A0A382H2Y0_9ZZZZ|nr:5'-methylthioadenosine/S-adenosylhomocysteine nucleosidase [SAR202 cluster bacterium]|tara:strand:+ start:734 stop:1366 length:633 start_codon:yes stop_codon:yes gene_type:complete